MAQIHAAQFSALDALNRLNRGRVHSMIRRSWNAALAGLPKPALHFVEALRHSYGCAARASSHGMTGLGKQNGFHLSLNGSRMVRAGLEARKRFEGAGLTCRGCGDGFVTRKGFTPVAPGGIRGQALLSGPMK